MKATRRNLGTAKAVVGRESIPLADLRVSGVSRLAEVEPDADYIKRLLASIEEVGLIHALTLIAANGTYEVIAGAHRLHALRRLRGKDGVLAPGEYRALPPDTPAEELLAISIKENADRTASAPVAEARHFARLVKEKRVSQAKLAKLNSTNRAWVGAALQLAERFDDLPECWRQDLSTPPDRKGDGPSITMTHWAETAPKLPPPPLAPQVIDDMVKAHHKRWSARRTANKVESTTGIYQGLYRPRPDDGERDPDAAARAEALAAGWDEDRGEPGYDDILAHLDTAKGLCRADLKLERRIVSARLFAVRRMRAD